MTETVADDIRTIHEEGHVSVLCVHCGRVTRHRDTYLHRECEPHYRPRLIFERRRTA